MKIDLSDGILIEGDKTELKALAHDLKWAAKNCDDGETVVAQMLTDEGAERFTIRRLADGVATSEEQSDAES